MFGWLPYWLAALSLVVQLASAPLHTAMASPGGFGDLAALGQAIGQDVAFCDHDAGRLSPDGAPLRDHRSPHEECALCQFAGHGGAIVAAAIGVPPGPLPHRSVAIAATNGDFIGRLDFLAARPRAPPRFA